MAQSLRTVFRGLVRRCPACGSKKIFESWFRLAPKCPRCEIDFEREPGWWIGAIIINTAVSMALFAVILGAGLAMYWPDVPWTGLEIVSLAAIAFCSIGFYPMSKTVWLGIDLLMAGMDRSVRE